MRKCAFLLVWIVGYANVSAQHNQLLIPPTLQGSAIDLTLQHGETEFFPGDITNTMGANGNILGPTLILERGTDVTLNVHNQLEDHTTIHWHGLHVAPENDGGPHTPIAPGTTWSPAFTVLDRAATYWYHPHLHHKTDEHVSKGIAGLIIVKDDIESTLELPRTYGVDDFPIVIQTKAFDENNQIIVGSNSDNVLMVNATIDPFVEVPAQIVRLRVLNGSSQRSFNLGLSNNEPFYQIASDAGLLGEPYQTTRLLLSPGERAEILLDLNDMSGENISLMSFASELPNGIYGAANPGMGPGMILNGYHPNPMNGNDFDVLSLVIVSQNADPVISLPSVLTEINPWNPSEVNETRSLTFSPASPGPNQLNGHFLINGATFDMETINFTIPLNNIEIWELTNQSAIAHPFHIHGVPFNVISRNGQAPPVNERGWKDVVMVRPMETVRFITKFETYYNDEIPYMYHCHMLTHEDDGMMGQFLVINTSTSIDDDRNIPENYLLKQNYPNPFNPSTVIPFTLNESGHVRLAIYDMTGRRLAMITDGFLQSGTYQKTFDATRFASGTYFYRLQFEGQTLTRKMILLK